jgi:monoterpene epsilon-lactone hydrolase
LRAAINKRRVSLRAELVRLGLRLLMKRRSGFGVGVADSRRRAASMQRLIPRPPSGTRFAMVDAGGVGAELVNVQASRADRHLLFLHGGGFVTGSPALYRHLTWRLAAAANARLLAVDYRLAPEHPFPAALDDAATAYRWLLDANADPRQIAVIGDSAGGGLTLSLLLRMRDEGMPLPYAAVALSPCTDLALTGPSLAENAEADPMLRPEWLPRMVRHYLAGADPRLPWASPLYGDPAGLPPTLFQVGSDEILRDDATRMAAHMRAAGCRVEMEIWPRMPHVWHLFAAILPEARRAIAGIGEFLERSFSRPATTPAAARGDRRR